MWSCTYRPVIASPGMGDPGAVRERRAGPVQRFGMERHRCASRKPPGDTGLTSRLQRGRGRVVDFLSRLIGAEHNWEEILAFVGYSVRWGVAHAPCRPNNSPVV